MGLPQSFADLGAQWRDAPAASSQQLQRGAPKFFFACVRGFVRLFELFYLSFITSNTTSLCCVLKAKVLVDQFNQCNDLLSCVRVST